MKKPKKNGWFTASRWDSNKQRARLQRIRFVDGVEKEWHWADIEPKKNPEEEARKQLEEFERKSDFFFVQFIERTNQVRIAVKMHGYENGYGRIYDSYQKALEGAKTDPNIRYRLELDGLLPKRSD